VVVVTDRTGADIVQAVGADEVGASAVDGESLHITRSAPGGWSQRRYQQRAENVWEDNARLVADAVTHAVDEIGARVVIVAGDVRARSFLLEHLPQRIVDLTVQADTSEPAGLAAETVRHTATVAAADTRECLEQLRTRPADHVTQGAVATVAALRAAAVDLLLVHDDPVDERTAWISDDPAVIALDQNTLAEPDNARQARLVDAAIRAALATGASVRIVPGHVVEDDLAARLRFPTPSVQGR
jgi:peptide subunit release factor 1 (eRF1)